MCNTNILQGESQPPSGALGIIYKITCLVTKKPYVGQTRQKLERRIAQHKSQSKKAEAGIDLAIAEYGWEGNFTVEVLEICPVEKLDEREKFWIATLNSKSPNGYNLTDGGSVTNPSEETRARISANHADVSGEKNPFYGQKHSEETRAIISAAKKGKSHKPHSKETRDKISASNKGKHSQNKGKPLSNEHRAKIAIARTAWWARKKAIENGGKK